jgi:lipoprotein-releasing system permease protein
VLQLWVLLRAVVHLAVVGLVAAIFGRRFSWSAFVLGLLPFAVAWLSSAVAGASPVPAFAVACLAAGLLVGLRAATLGLWECYLLILVVGAAAYVQLAVGWWEMLSPEPSYFELLGPIAPGVRMLGQMWPRIFAISAVAAVPLTLFASSLAHARLYRLGQARFEWMVAWRHLTQAGGVSITTKVAVLGIALGVAALICLTAIMSGYQREVRDRILSTNAHLTLQRYGVDFVAYAEAAAKALSVPGVVAASPFVHGDAMLSHGDAALSVMIKGIDPASAGHVTAIGDNLCRAPAPGAPCERGEGDLARVLQDRDGMPALVLGATLFRKVGQPVGSVVTLTTPVGLAGARGDAPKRMRFHLAGVFRCGMHEFDSRLAYSSIAGAQALMGLGDAVTGLEIRVDDPGAAPRLADAVLAAVGHYPFRIRDWHELNLGLFTALMLQKAAMFLVLCAIIVVASFNIASTLFMSVVEKSHEIGVLKSMGAADASILRIFMLEGWVVGGLGTACGVLLGMAVVLLLRGLDLRISADVYMVDAVRVFVQPKEVAGTVAAALVIAHLATLVPALRASLQRPVDALRYP